MKPIFPNKLKPGDEVRVIAPSRSMDIISRDTKGLATNALEKLGLQVTFGQHVNEQDIMYSSSIASRIADLHEAFSDQNVKAIFSVIEGYNANQLLEFIQHLSLLSRLGDDVV